MMEMIEVDIWSDVRCPFCYIGKHNFEAALVKFPKKEKVQVSWHSFQLDPNVETRPDLNALDYFVEVKGVTREQARQMFQRAGEMAKEIGLDPDLENTVVANSYRAHLLIQLAKEKGIDNDMEEALFEAYFRDLKNIDDEGTLLQIAESVGIGKEEALKALESESYAYAVKQDEMQAQQIGVRGVPFFVFNNKYAVSGAQPPETFLEVLEKLEQEK